MFEARLPAAWRVYNIPFSLVPLFHAPTTTRSSPFSRTDNIYQPIMPRGAEETRPERFPFFPSGDVKIVVTDARQYQLHSSVLKNSSPLLERLLHPADAAQLTAKAVKAGVTTQYKLMVVESAAVDGRVDYVLEPVRLDPNGRPRDGNPRGVRAGFEGGRSLPGALAAYGAVLGAMYGEPIDLGDFHEDGLAHLMSNAVEITEVAEYLGCVCFP